LYFLSEEEEEVEEERRGLFCVSIFPFLLHFLCTGPLFAPSVSFCCYFLCAGPLIVEVLNEYLATDCHHMCRMVPDEIPDIVAALREFVAAGCLRGVRGESSERRRREMSTKSWGEEAGGRRRRQAELGACKQAARQRGPLTLNPVSNG